MFNYSRIAATALKLIANFGQVVTITSRAQGGYNPSTGMAAVTETTQTTRGVIDQYKAREVDGTLIQVGDSKLILAAQGMTAPTINDTVTLADSSKLTVRSIDPISPAGSPIIYICQVRK